MKKEVYLQIRNEIRGREDRLVAVKHFALDLLLLSGVLVGAFSSFAWWTHLLLSPVIAILMFRNFSMMHEAVHSAASPSRRSLNSAIGVWCGSLCLLPFEPWKKIHLEHHLWSGNIDKDPSMSLVKIFPKWPAALRATLNFFWKSWIPVMACLQYGVFGMHSLALLLKNFRSPAYLASVLTPALIWAGVLFLAPVEFLFCGLMPGVYLYFLAIEIVNFPHHLELPKLESEEKDKLWDQHKTARSCIYPRWIAQYVVLNFNYHIEHHLYPREPWHHLPKIHNKLTQELGEGYNTDPQFAWILKNRKRSLEEILADEGHSHSHDLEEARFGVSNGQADRSKFSA